MDCTCTPIVWFVVNIIPLYLVDVTQDPVHDKFVEMEFLLCRSLVQGRLEENLRIRLILGIYFENSVRIEGVRYLFRTFYGVRASRPTYTPISLSTLRSIPLTASRCHQTVRDSLDSQFMLWDVSVGSGESWSFISI